MALWWELMHLGIIHHASSLYIIMHHLGITNVINVHHVPKCMSCHKAIVVITRMPYCFHNYIYTTPILLLWDLGTLFVVNHLWPLNSIVQLNSYFSFFMFHPRAEPYHLIHTLFSEKMFDSDFVKTLRTLKLFFTKFHNNRFCFVCFFS